MFRIKGRLKQAITQVLNPFVLIKPTGSRGGSGCLPNNMWLPTFPINPSLCILSSCAYCNLSGLEPPPLSELLIDWTTVCCLVWRGGLGDMVKS